MATYTSPRPNHDTPVSPAKFGRAAFTLIELLVVISIISLLISILLPALKAAREQGRAIRCLSQERQIGIATLAYVSDHDGFFMPINNRITPTKTREPADLLIGGRYIPQDVVDTAGKGTEVFVCPVGPNRYAASSSQSASGLVWVHYGYNHSALGGHLPTSATRKVPIPRIDNLIQTSNMYMFMDSAANDSFLQGSYRVYNRGPTSAGTPHARHPGTSLNILYVDGHAASLRVSDLMNPWADLGAWNSMSWWGGITPVW